MPPGADGVEHFAGEQPGDTGNPRIGRFGDHDVVRGSSEHHVGPAVAHDQTRPRVGQSLPVLASEMLRRLDHFSRNFNRIDSLDRMGQGTSECHAAPVPDDGNATGVGMQEQRQMSQQSLRQHVAGVRRVDLPVDGK